MRDRRKKILLIEDNPADVRLVKEMLAEASAARFQLSHVEGMSRALKSLAENSFDIILLDLSLPDSQGLDSVIQTAAAAPGVPIVVMSGLSDEELAVRAVHEGAQDYLVKGNVDSNLLVRSIRYATERKLAEEETRRRGRQLEALQQVSQAVSQSLDLEAVSSLALEEVIRVLSLDAGTIHYIDDAARESVMLADKGLSPELTSEFHQAFGRQKLGKGLLSQVAESGQPIIIGDFLQHTRHPFMARSGFQSAAFLPLKVRETVVGVITGFCRHPHSFTPADMEMISSLGNMVGMAIANARLYEGQKRRTEEMTTLHQLSQAVSGSLDLEAVSSQALEATLRVLDLDAGEIYYIDEVTQDAILLTVRGWPPELTSKVLNALGKHKAGEGFIGRAAQSGQLILIEDVPQQTRHPFVAQSGFQSSIHLPLKVQGKVMGVLSGATRRQRTFTPADMEMMASLGNMVGMAIANARLFGQVEAAGREWGETFNAMSDGVAILSPDFRIRRANRALAGILGTTTGALEGVLCCEAIHGRREPIADCTTVNCLAGKQASDLVKQEPHLGNRWLQVRSDPVLGPSDEVLGIVHTVRDITEIKQAEEKLQGRTHDLGERVKELNCLYSISRIVEKPGITLTEALKEIVEVIPPSWQYPEVTCARIIVEGKEFRTGNLRETAWKQTADIMTYGKPSGTLEVFYLEEKPESDEGPFLNEERSLVNAIAEQVGRVTELKRAEESLQESAKRILKLAAATVQAHEEERQWIAMEVHDRIAQNLSSAFQQLQILDYLPPGEPEARLAANNASVLLKEAIGETRNVMDDLYPPTLNEFGLVPMLREELYRFQADTGCGTRLNVDCPEGLPRHVEVTLYRVFHEALINVRKHAAGARNATVSLACRDHVVKLLVEDDGPGFDVEAATQKKRVGGLTSMQRRTEIVSGNFEVTSCIGRGTRVNISAPLGGGNGEGRTGQ